jgi:hypothetical protein
MSSEHPQREDRMSNDVQADVTSSRLFSRQVLSVIQTVTSDGRELNTLLTQIDSVVTETICLSFLFFFLHL